MMANWTFLTSHAWAMLCIAHDPGVRLRDIAASRGITERSAYGTVTDLAKAGYVVRPKNGRLGHYQTRAHQPQGCPISCRDPPAPRTYQERCQPLRLHDESSAGPGSGLRVRPRLTIRRN